MDSARMRSLLQAEITSVDTALEEATRSAAVVELDQSSIGRVSRVDALQQQAMAKGYQQRLTTRRRQLEAALTRLEAGKYGFCCHCRNALDDERLMADPATVFCTPCAEDRQHA